MEEFSSVRILPLSHAEPKKPEPIRARAWAARFGAWALGGALAILLLGAFALAAALGLAIASLVFALAFVIRFASFSPRQTQRAEAEGWRVDAPGATG